MASESAKSHGAAPRVSGSPIRILYVIDSLVAGGVESQMVDLIARLDRARFEPHVLVLYGAPRRPPHFLERLRDLTVPVTILDLGTGSRDKLQALRSILAATWRLRPAITQAENYHANLLTRAARPLMPHGTRLIGAIRAASTPHQLRWDRLQRGACDVIVASASHLERQLIERAGVTPERLVVIPNSIDVARFTGGPDSAARAAELRARLAPHARRLLISMGRIARDKRPDLLAEAIALLKRDGIGPEEAHLAIIGPVEHEDVREALDQVIEREGLGDRITCLGPAPNPETYFAACDASVLASPIEGLPVVALESLAAARPVVLSEGANAAGVIEDGATGWVARTNDPAALAAALRRMLAATEGELAEMGAHCRSAAQGYDLATLAERYMALYDALLATPRAAAPGARRGALASAQR